MIKKYRKFIIYIVTLIASIIIIGIGATHVQSQSLDVDFSAVRLGQALGQGDILWMTLDNEGQLTCFYHGQGGSRNE